MGGFMKSEHLPDAGGNWGHESMGIPSTALRAPSPPLEEKDGMRGFGLWTGLGMGMRILIK
jgi:hypothetical protein